MSKVTVSNPATPTLSASTPMQPVRRPIKLNGHRRVHNLKTGLRGAPTNCMSNETGRKAGPWRTG